jgi:hypothetical protein
MPTDVYQHGRSAAREFWSLAQVLTWIIRLSPQEVVALHPERPTAAPRVAQSDPSPFDIPPKQTLESSAFDVLNDIARSGNEKLWQSGDMARTDLIDKLIAGTLTAFGIPRGETEHKKIESASWLTISSLDGPNPNLPADAVWAITESSPRFLKVRCAAADVRRLWPAPAKGKEPIPLDSEVKKVIRDALAAKGANLTSREAEKICAEQCAGVTRKNFRALLETVQGPPNLGRPRKPK